MAAVDWESELADIPAVNQAGQSTDWEKELADVPVLSPQPFQGTGGTGSLPVGYLEDAM